MIGSLLIAAILASSAPAATPMADQTPTPIAAMPPLAPPVYVTPETLDLARTLPGWPGADTLAAEADIVAVLAIQSRRSAAEVADAQADSTTTMVDWTRKLLGPGATPETMPRLFALMAALHQDMRRVNRAANAAHGERPRPVLADPRVRPAIDMAGHGGASYPSARASSALVWADVIGRIAPEHAAAAQAEAERIGWRRVVGGVHYPSDLAGSAHVAGAVTAALAASTTFAQAVAEAKRQYDTR